MKAHGLYAGVGDLQRKPHGLARGHAAFDVAARRQVFVGAEAAARDESIVVVGEAQLDDGIGLRETGLVDEGRIDELCVLVVGVGLLVAFLLAVVARILLQRLLVVLCL